MQTKFIFKTFNNSIQKPALTIAEMSDASSEIFDT